MKVATRRLLEEQIAAVVVLERGEKIDAIWHVPQKCACLFKIHYQTKMYIFFIVSLFIL